jgi:hypothetical protein
MICINNKEDTMVTQKLMVVGLMTFFLVQGIVGCNGSSEVNTKPIHFSSGALSAGALSFGSSVPAPSDVNATDLAITGTQENPVVKLFGVSLNAQTKAFGEYLIDPKGNEDVAAALWERTSAMAPTSAPWMSSWVGLDETVPIVLKVGYDRYGEIVSAKLDFGLLVSKNAVVWALTAQEVLSHANLADLINQVPANLGMDAGTYRLTATMSTTDSTSRWATQEQGLAAGSGTCACVLRCTFPLNLKTECKQVCSELDGTIVNVNVGTDLCGEVPAGCAAVCLEHGVPPEHRAASFKDACGFALASN